MHNNRLSGTELQIKEILKKLEGTTAEKAAGGLLLLAGEANYDKVASPRYLFEKAASVFLGKYTQHPQYSSLMDLMMIICNSLNDGKEEIKSFSNMCKGMGETILMFNTEESKKAEP